MILTMRSEMLLAGKQEVNYFTCSSMVGNRGVSSSDIQLLIHFVLSIALYVAVKVCFYSRILSRFYILRNSQVCHQGMMVHTISNALERCVVFIHAIRDDLSPCQQFLWSTAAFQGRLGRFSKLVFCCCCRVVDTFTGWAHTIIWEGLARGKVTAFFYKNIDVFHLCHLIHLRCAVYEHQTLRLIVGLW